MDLQSVCLSSPSPFLVLDLLQHQGLRHLRVYRSWVLFLLRLLSLLSLSLCFFVLLEAEERETILGAAPMSHVTVQGLNSGAFHMVRYVSCHVSSLPALLFILLLLLLLLFVR